MLLESPYLVWRDLDSGAATTVSIAELCQMRKVAQRLIFDAESGNEQARQTIVMIAELVKNPAAPNRGRAIISAHLLQDVRSELLAWQAQQAQLQAQQAQISQAQGQTIEMKSEPTPQEARPPSQEAPSKAQAPFVAKPPQVCRHGYPIDMPCEMCQSVDARNRQAKKVEAA